MICDFAIRNMHLAYGELIMAQDNDDMFSGSAGDDEQLTPFDVRDSSGKAGLTKLLLGFGALLLLALIILKVYQPGTRDRDVPPTISSDNTPFKEAPASVGGVQVPNQDKAVYDMLDGKGANEVVKAETGAEIPIELPKTANIKVDPAPVVVPKVVKPKVVAAAPKAPTPTRTVATGTSEWVVQVASVRSEADANRIWNKTYDKFNHLLGSGVYSDVKYADLAEKGVYYRLRVAGLADKNAANSLCEQFKAGGQACFVTRR